jgi:MFS family permease
MKEKITRNIPILFVIQIFRWFLMIMPTIVLFFQENGLTLFQVMLTQAAFSATIVIFEIPSGYFSDKIGRKVTMITGLLFSMSGMYLFALAPRFSGFLAAEILLGLGSSFISGTDSSLLYDTLITLNDEESHHKREGLFMSLGNYSESTASILGGLVAAYSMKFNFLIEGTLLLAAIILALFLVEPEREKEGKEALTISHFMKDVKIILSRKTTLYLVSYGALSGLGTFLALWYIQPEMAARGLPVALFGVIWAGLNVLVGIGSTISHKLPGKVKPLKILAFIPFLIALSYGSLIVLPGLWILAGFICFYMIRGLKNPFERNLLHREVTSSNRATVLSLQSMMMRLSFTIGGPLFALLSRDEGNSLVYGAIGLLYLIWGLINLSILQKKSRISLP